MEWPECSKETKYFTMVKLQTTQVNTLFFTRSEYSYLTHGILQSRGENKENWLTILLQTIPLTDEDFIYFDRLRIIKLMDNILNHYPYPSKLKKPAKNEQHYNITYTSRHLLKFIHFWELLQPWQNCRIQRLVRCNCIVHNPRMTWIHKFHGH